MNSNQHLLDILTKDGGDASADTNGMPVSNSALFPATNRNNNNINVNDNGGEGVMHDILHPHPPRSSLQHNGDQEHHLDRPITEKFFGLNLGRSQTAAPETWDYDNLPSSTKSATTSYSNIDSASEIFGEANRRRGFFDHYDEEEDHDGFMRLGMRRPASTGVIGRPNNRTNHDNDEGVNSILETLGITSLEVSPDKNYRDVSESFVTGEHIPSNQIREWNRDPNKGPTYFQGGEGELPSSDIFSNQGIGNSQIGLQYGIGNNHHNQQQQQQQPNHRDQQPSTQGSEYASLQVNTSQYALQDHQDSSTYGFQQQQVYYQQKPQASPQADQTTNYRANGNMLQSTITIPQMNAGQQQTGYHINSPAASSYGFEYQVPQQQQYGSVPSNHIILPHQQILGTTTTMQGQPQYISIVPIQTVMAQSISGGGTAHHGSQPTYAYVQYGDGSIGITSPSNLVAGDGGGGGTPATTFVMSPNGPIAVSSSTPSHAVPVNVFNFSGNHCASSPAGSSGLRSPTRLVNGGGNNLKSPDRNIPCQGRSSKKNQLSSPRGGRRMDKNPTTPSKLGPEASYLLNEIRAAKSRNMWTIHDIRGHVVEFCIDQNGSRFIQQRLEVSDVEEKNAVMEEVIPAMKELQNDVFGNYVVQKLFEFGTDSMKKELKGALTGNVVLLSLQMHGCRVVQKALESLDYDDLTDLLQELDSCVLTCIQDQNGNHVMQKIVEVMSTKASEVEGMTGDLNLSNSMAMRIQFIVNDVLANVRTLCCHPYGCRVLQRMLEHCVAFQKSATLDAIQHCHRALLDDQYGNYVIQHVLQYGRESDRDSLLDIVVSNDLLKLSRQKFASNVVEKLLKYGNSNQRNAIVREMLKVVNDGGAGQEGVGSSVLLLMVRDAYANYVVQTAIDVVPEGIEKRMMLDELKTHEVQLKLYFCKTYRGKATGTLTCPTSAFIETNERSQMERLQILNKLTIRSS